MSDDPTYLPEPWYCDDRRSLTCDLCRDAVDELWLLSPHRPPDLRLGLALHDAHQSHVETWIAAAGDKLHQAILDHLAATRDQHRPDSSRT
jgi:hypothetical protein